MVCSSALAFQFLAQPLLASKKLQSSQFQCGALGFAEKRTRYVAPASSVKGLKCRKESIESKHFKRKDGRYSVAFPGALVKITSLGSPRSDGAMRGCNRGKDGDFQCHQSESDFGGLQASGLHRSRSWKPHFSLSEEAVHIASLDLETQDNPDPHNLKSSLGSLTEDICPLDSDCPQDNHGKSGLVTFYGYGNQQSQQVQLDLESPKKGLLLDLLWLIGPTALVSSVILPPLYLRRIFEVVLDDSLVTDFLILFLTETLFYMGVSAFLFVVYTVQKSAKGLAWSFENSLKLGYKLSSIITMLLGVLLPIGTFAIVSPWTGPAAAAALVPYTAGLVVQFAFEQFVEERASPVWPLIPVVFQVYRLHQLNRAAQLVAGLLFSLRGAEATAETLAVNGSLQTLLTVLQLLGILCLWSLAAFLMHAFLHELQPTRAHEMQTSRTSPFAEAQ